MREAYHVARADFLQRVRSRKLVVVLAVVAYFGYLVNVGGIELAYQVETADTTTNVHGTNTSEFVGLKAGLTGATVLLFGGFYLMNATLERDRTNDIDRLVASTPISDWAYLFGKWMSNVGLSAVIVVALGVATVVNHLIHGVGQTELFTLVAPLILFAIPLGALVGAVALLFETVDWLSGTGGNIGYFFLASFALAGLNVADGKLPEALPVWVKAIDLLGQLAVYELTIDALHTIAPTYDGGPPLFGTLDANQTYSYVGRGWPLWVFVQRVWLLVPAVTLLSVATLQFDRLYSTDSSEQSGLLSRVATLLPRHDEADSSDDTAVETLPIDSLSLTPVKERNGGSFWRLVKAEARLTIRGRQWWWYAVTVALISIPIASVLPIGLSSLPVEFARKIVLPLAFVWPIFLWSDLGVRTIRHQITDLIFSSKYSLKQVVAEWLSGVVVAGAISSGLVVLFVSAGETGALLGVVSGIVFVPSLAIAMGMWSRSSSLFEMLYLLLWYAGPLNGGTLVDFVGSTAESVEMGVPIGFVGLSVVLIGIAVARRKLELG